MVNGMPVLSVVCLYLLSVPEAAFTSPLLSRHADLHTLTQEASDPSFRSQGFDLASQRPVVTGEASPQLFKYASSVAVRVLTEQFPQAKLPAVNTDFHVPVLGTFHLTVDAIQLGKLSLDPARTGISLNQDGSHLLLSAERVSTSATCHFHLVRRPFSSRSVPSCLPADTCMHVNEGVLTLFATSKSLTI